MVEVVISEIWFLVGSQHLYGPAVLEEVESNGRTISQFWQQHLKVDLRFKGVVAKGDEVLDIMYKANADNRCAGIVVWMHTFSPAQMWINGLRILDKPLLHLHTQFTSDIPWSKIDMDYMNVHQSAHGGREFGFLTSKMDVNRKVLVGHWKDESVLEEISSWMDVCRAWQSCRGMKIARLGDNMREVAVTEGNKVSAHIQFGYSVDGYGMSSLVEEMESVTESEVMALVDEYEDSYHLGSSLLQGGIHRQHLKDAARIELGLLRFLEGGGFSGFTDTFENLTGLPQLPGIAVQRLMQRGYGFGAEGDWKTAALLRMIKVLGRDRSGGSSFMEDYTYDDMLGEGRVLAAHMLEICPSITSQTPSCEIHPLSIGGKDDPVRLVFDADPGPGINVSLIDLGHRFRMVVSEVEVEKTPEPLPVLPVARAYWRVKPSFHQGIEAWLLAGGGHHTCFSQQVSTGEMVDLAGMMDIECLVIDEGLDLHRFRQDIRLNEVYFGR
ncbi:L-arabinose isomerase [Membranihabitans marinus]|uniref:L-arabinose isomerase n=1 Tax=Membranihabitans marinus TaxID=1227546 RepID=UPI00374D2EAC